MRASSAMLLALLATSASIADGAALSRPMLSRRACAGALLFGCMPSAVADEPSSIFVGSAVADEPSSIFVGRYTDPNHPGGVREVTLLPDRVGAYRLANVRGGGGKGEPPLYDLPAIIIERAGTQQIVIDFSVPPKYGPRDFAGQWDASTGSGGIRFVRDGNFWPKQQ